MMYMYVLCLIFQSISFYTLNISMFRRRPILLVLIGKGLYNFISIIDFYGKLFHTEIAKTSNQDALRNEFITFLILGDIKWRSPNYAVLTAKV